MLIYHLVLPEKWAAFDSDLYEAESLYTEGFIHCSFASQLGKVTGHLAEATRLVVGMTISFDERRRGIAYPLPS